jgi:hypothetical protein
MKTHYAKFIVKIFVIAVFMFNGLNTEAQVHTIDVYISQPEIEDCLYQNLGGANDINETKNKAYDFKVIPNPNKGIFKVSIKNHELINKITFIVTNMNGEYAFKKTFDYESAEIVQNIDLTSLPAGIYFLHIRNNNINDSKKIIIQ